MIKTVMHAVMRFSWIFVANAFICQVCVLEIFPQVAAENYTINTLQVYTIGETAKMFSPRSDREGLNQFKKYRTWKSDVVFAILKKGAQTAYCPQDVSDVLQQFCLQKVEFKIWNATHLILEVKDTTFNDSGNYSVEHVFGGLEGNHKDIIPLKIEDLSTTSLGNSSVQSVVCGACTTALPIHHTSDLSRTSSVSSSVQSVVVGASTTALPIHHTSDLSTTSSVSSSVQSVVVGESTTALPVHHTSDLSTSMSGPSGRTSSGGISVIILGTGLPLFCSFCSLFCKDLFSVYTAIQA